MTSDSYCLTFDQLGFVDTPHVLQNAVVERLSELSRHGRVKVRLVALQYTLKSELTHAQHFQVSLHHTFTPRSAILVLKEPKVQDLAYPENVQRRSG